MAKNTTKSQTIAKKSDKKPVVNKTISKTNIKTKDIVKSTEKSEKTKKSTSTKEKQNNTPVELEIKTEKKPTPIAKNTESKKETNPEPVVAPIQEGSLEKFIRLKLEALFSLQTIDTQIDKIRIIRGELPLEVQDLEDEIAGLNTRLENFKLEITSIEKSKSEYSQEILNSKEMIKKYEQQQKRSYNREFESLSKEIEFQDLEIQLRNKN